MLCRCGCGQLTPIAATNNTRRGWIRGQPIKYIVNHYKAKPSTTMYRAVSIGHGKGVVRVHIATARRALGRSLPKGAVVHHVDGDKRNNANANLVICQDQAYHALLHARARIVRAGGDPDRVSLCPTCGLLKPRTEFDSNRRKWSKVGGWCRECHRLYRISRKAQRAGESNAA